MDWTLAVDATVFALEIGLVAFLAYGAYLALGGDRARRDAPTGDPGSCVAPGQAR